MLFASRKRRAPRRTPEVRKRVHVHQPTPEATFLPHMMAWAREASKQGSSCKPHVPAELTPELSPALPLSALERTGIRARQRDMYQRPRTSDHQVVAQVAHEYPPLVTALLQSGLPVRTVLDAGANAGFSTNTLAAGLPESYVVGLEPDADNYAMLRLNTRGLTNVMPLRAALWAPGSKHVQLFNGTNIHTSRQWYGPAWPKLPSAFRWRTPLILTSPQAISDAAVGSRR